MKSSEWTLMFFTLLAQTAAGLFLALCLTNNLTNWKNGLAGGKAMNDKLLFLICAILAAALILSFFHLGNIKNAIYTLSNMSSSWLSREILFVMIFGFLAVLFTLVSVKNIFSFPVQNIIGISAVASGIILIFVMAKIYMLKNIPAWNSVFTPVSFYFSTFILGGLTFLAALLYLLQRQGADVTAIPQLTDLAKVILKIIFFLLLAELIAWLSQILILSNGERAAVESYNLIVKDNCFLFAARILLQAAGLVLLVFLYLSFGKGTFNYNHLYLIYIIILLAEFAGRYLFYAMFAGIGI